jgi:hypothetical protein
LSSEDLADDSKCHYNNHQLTTGSRNLQSRILSNEDVDIVLVVVVVVVVVVSRRQHFSDVLTVAQ